MDIEDSNKENVKQELENMLSIENDSFSDFETLEQDDFIDFEALENDLRAEIDSQLSELKILEDNRKKIGNPESLGKTIKDVVWEQFKNQIGVEAGVDFIEKNKGFTLDLSDDAHIQTPENFADGKIAKHNYKSKDQLEQNYNRYKNKPHDEFRKEHVNPGMDKTLKRAGELNKEGVETVKDIYTGRQIPTKTKLENGKNNPNAAQREHVKSSAELYQNPSLQMANNNEELAAVINDSENLQGYTTAGRNNRKSDKSSNEMEKRDKNEHWKKADEKAEKHVQKKEREGEERLKKEGRETQLAEGFRLTDEALRAFIMNLLAELVRKIIRKLIAWLQSAEKSINTFLKNIKLALTEFVMDLKKEVLSATDTFVTAIVTAIFGPIVKLIKKAWILLKQSAQTIKEAIDYIKKPENRAKSFETIMMEVGKIVIVGLSAAGAIVLGEVIEKALLSIPFFAFPIPAIGSLASIFGIFLGALVCGIVGALALRLIDKASAKHQLAQFGQQEDFIYVKAAQTEADLALAKAGKTGTQVLKTEEAFVTSAAGMSEKRKRTKKHQDETQSTMDETENVVNQTADKIDELLNSDEEEFEL